MEVPTRVTVPAVLFVAGVRLRAIDVRVRRPRKSHVDATVRLSLSLYKKLYIVVSYYSTSGCCMMSSACIQLTRVQQYYIATL